VNTYGPGCAFGFLSRARQGCQRQHQNQETRFILYPTLHSTDEKVAALITRVMGLGCRRQNDRRTLGDHQRMLVVRRRPVIGHDHGPLVLRHECSARSSAIIGSTVITRPSVRTDWPRDRQVRHPRFFMDRASNAVPSQVANHGESAAPHLALDHSPDFPKLEIRLAPPAWLWRKPAPRM